VGSNQNKDNSKFVEHLRLIHFTLLASCLVGVIAITSTSPSFADRAYNQTNQLLAIAQYWQRGKWLEDLLAKEHSKIEAIRTNIPNILRYRSKESHSTNFSFLYPHPGAEVPHVASPIGVASNEPLFATYRKSTHDWLTLATKLGDDGRIATTDFSEGFSTLGAGQKTWDALDRFSQLVSLNGVRGGWYIDAKGKAVEIEPVPDAEQAALVPHSGLPDSGLRLYLRTDLIEEFSATTNKDLPAAHSLLAIIEKSRDSCYLSAGRVDERGVGLFVLEGSCSAQPAFLQSLFVQQLNAPQPPPGTFVVSFPDVAELGKHLSGLSLSDLRLFVAAERNRSGEKIELPIVKIPEQSISGWGDFIILALTGYFLAVFRDFANRVAGPSDAAWDIPWGGTSAEPLSRIAFVISLSAPIVVASILAWRGIRTDLSVFTIACYGFALIGIVAMIIGILSCHAHVLRMKIAP
jgi:hypothetical protein